MSEGKRPYFGMMQALKNIKNASGAKETSISTTELVGKGLFNIVRFTITEAIPSITKEIIKNSVDQSTKSRKLSDSIINSGSSSDEMLEKAKKLREFSDKISEKAERMKESIPEYENLVQTNNQSLDKIKESFDKKQ